MSAISHLLLYCQIIIVFSNLLPDDVFETIIIALDSRMSCFYQTLKDTHNVSIVVEPATEVKLGLRLTSPSGGFSKWKEGNSTSPLVMKHEAKENGDYELCITAPIPATVLLHIFAYDVKVRLEDRKRIARGSDMAESMAEKVVVLKDKMNEIEMSVVRRNKIYHRDEQMQHKNSVFIMVYVVLFCVAAAITSSIQVVVVRRMFHCTPGRV